MIRRCAAARHRPHWLARSFGLDKPLREARDEFEKAYFEYHLAKENGSMTRVAEKKTGLERTHLYRKLKQLGVDLTPRQTQWRQLGVDGPVRNARFRRWYTLALWPGSSVGRAED